jgi:hypothetical protein
MTRVLWEVLPNAELQIRFGANPAGRVDLVSGKLPFNSP